MSNNEKSESTASLLPQGGKKEDKKNVDKKPAQPEAGTKSTASHTEFAELAKKHGWGSATPSGASFGG
ncbi:hypothetical protein BD626DRAFT_631275 [Schizophyllum amplum]|uniref:Uncharacterized protein n=1 Tax=Schizophyllum amplum TaxID=97359 RepID=A0A550CBA8_9AGAR|nr:hypothetical protein BD626DRAFT_631275 [Auriculariopsis ampla]